MVQKSRATSLNVAILSVTSVVYFTLNYLFEWPIFAGEYLGAKPKFLDLHQTLKQVDCVKSAMNLGASFATSTTECEYVYSRPLYQFISLLDLQQQDIVWLGPIFGLLLICSLVFIAHISSMTLSVPRTLFAVLLICSPPIMLLVERANIDILIFLMVIFAAISAFKGFRFFALIILVICTLIKFYTIVTVWIVWALTKKWKRIALLAPLLFMSLYVLGDFLRIADNSPYPTKAAFGNVILGKYLQSGSSSRLVDFIVGAIAVLICWAILRRFIVTNRSILRMSDSSVSLRLNEAVFWLSSTVFVCCYSITSNWDYRLVFLLGQILILWPKIPNATPQKWVFLVKSLLLGSLWLSFNSGVLQVLGDLVIGLIFVLIVMLWTENWKLVFEVWRERT